MTEAIEIARRYALKRGYDIITPAGEKDGYKYFDIFREDLKGIKSGLPRIVKVSPHGRAIFVENISEIMWANAQNIKLNKSRNSK